MEHRQSTGTGIGFLGLLTILFIGLRLGHVIDWPWWAVLSPLWAPVVVVVASFGFAILAIGIAIGITALLDVYGEHK